MVTKFCQISVGAGPQFSFCNADLAGLLWSGSKTCRVSLIFRMANVWLLHLTKNHFWSILSPFTQKRYQCPQGQKVLSSAIPIRRFVRKGKEPYFNRTNGICSTAFSIFSGNCRKRCTRGWKTRRPASFAVCTRCRWLDAVRVPAGQSSIQWLEKPE